ncbi:MAG: protein kinase [Myxococcales bacterium]|nr:protein kinase [Myxococcales bacterium]
MGYMGAFKKGREIKSPVSGVSYRIQRVLGQGGFGTAYLADELNRRGKPADMVCLKTTLDQASWHRESYFGELLRRSKRAIQTLDSFPLMPKGGRSAIQYCLVLELAEHGTVADYLEKTGKAWTPARAKREIIALLRMLDQLHGASATHRDITPMNIFVCGNGTLKLGDFGIARHQLAGAPQTVDAFNPAFVTAGMASDARRYWQTADDVYQMGQLLAMLLRGDPQTIVKPRMVDSLGLEDGLKAIVKRAIGPRKKRYADAFEMLQALVGDKVSGADQAPLRSLVDKTVVFTGPLNIKRFDAEVLVLQSGGKVAKEVNKDVDVVVQGGRSPHYKGGHKGRKLLAAEKLAKKGQKITFIGEAEFRRLTRQEAN